MPNIASVTVRGDDFGQVVVMAHNSQPLSDEEWETGYLASIRKMKEDAPLFRSGNLVFAEGRGPTPKQRKISNAIYGDGTGYQLRVAVVTESLMVRGAVTALSWFNPRIDAFKPTDWRRAVNHLELKDKHTLVLAAALRELRSKIADVGILNQVLTDLNARSAVTSAGPP
jgi:hypothetical protein